MINRRKAIAVVLCERDCWAAVSGPDAVELLAEVGSRPLWSPARRAWMVGLKSASNLLALADSRGVRVSYDEVP